MEFFLRTYTAVWQETKNYLRNDKWYWGSKICITRIIEEKNMAKKRETINKQSMTFNINLRKIHFSQKSLPIV